MKLNHATLSWLICLFVSLRTSTGYAILPMPITTNESISRKNKGNGSFIVNRHIPTARMSSSTSKSTSTRLSMVVPKSCRLGSSPVVLFSKNGDDDDEKIGGMEMEDGNKNRNAVANPEEDDSTYEERMDLGGFAGYLGPYVAALLLSIGVTAAFVKFVLMDY